MASTVKHQPSTSEYILVISGTTNEFLLQNVSTGNTAVYIVWAAALPVGSTIGHLLRPGDGLTRNSLTGQVFARALTADAIVAATEE